MFVVCYFINFIVNKQKSQDFVRAVKNLFVVKTLSDDLSNSRTLSTHATHATQATHEPHATQPTHELTRLTLLNQPTQPPPPTIYTHIYAHTTQDFATGPRGCESDDEVTQ